MDDRICVSDVLGRLIKFRAFKRTVIALRPCTCCHPKNCDLTLTSPLHGVSHWDNSIAFALSQAEQAMLHVKG